MSGGTALRLARHFATTPAFWPNMQRDYDLECARETLGAWIDAEVRPRAA